MITATPLMESVPTTLASNSRPSGSVTLTSFALATTWELVKMYPSSVTMTPEPSPCRSSERRERPRGVWPKNCTPERIFDSNRRQVGQAIGSWRCGDFHHSRCDDFHHRRKTLATCIAIPGSRLVHRYVNRLAGLHGLRCATLFAAQDNTPRAASQGLTTIRALSISCLHCLAGFEIRTHAQKRIEPRSNPGFDTEVSQFSCQLRAPCIRRWIASGNGLEATHGMTVGMSNVRRINLR